MFYKTHRIHKFNIYNYKIHSAVTTICDKVLGSSDTTQLFYYNKRENLYIRMIHSIAYNIRTCINKTELSLDSSSPSTRSNKRLIHPTKIQCTISLFKSVMSAVALEKILD